VNGDDANSTLRIRLTTSAILAAPSVAGVVFLPTLGVALVWGVVLGLAAWEWGWLLGSSRRGRAACLIACALLTGLLLLLPAEVLALGLPLWALGAWYVWRHEQGGEPPSRAARLLFAVAALPLAAAALVTLHARGGGPACLTLFTLVWTADSVAYLVGKHFGRHRLAPLVSPGKTREGTLAACLLAPPAALAVAGGLGVPVSGPVSFLISLLPVVLFAMVGDLYESLMKRVAGRKDSGVLLPGHGGALDRLDSLIAAAPAFCVLVPIVPHH
jgi:phosphatidate cytidylyltransferase